MKGTGSIAADGELFQSAAEQSSLTGLEPLHGRQVSGREIFRKVLQRRHVLAHEIGDVLRDLSGRIVDLAPSARAFRKEVGDHHSCDDAVGDALP